MRAPSACVVAVFSAADKQAVKMTRPHCHRFRANEARLGLGVLAYNRATCGKLKLPPYRAAHAQAERRQLDTQFTTELNGAVG
jgi:hypothetical protein